MGSRGVHHQCPSRSGLSSLAAACGLSFPAFGYGQCYIRICLYLIPPPALKSQNWRYRLRRSRCMENAFVALAGYGDNMERTHRFQSELPKAIAIQFLHWIKSRHNLQVRMMPVYLRKQTFKKSPRGASIIRRQRRATASEDLALVSVVRLNGPLWPQQQRPARGARLNHCASSSRPPLREIDGGQLTFSGLHSLGR